MTIRYLLTNISGLFLVVATLWGCADHQTGIVVPGTNRLRVKTITQVTGTPSVSMVSAFSYDGQNRLSLIRAYQSPDSTMAPVENTGYQYDAQSRLTQVQHAVVRRGSNAETYTLTYNGAGQLAQLANLPSTFSISPQYDPANQLAGYSKAIAVGGLQSTGGGTLTFTGTNLTTVSEVFSVFRSGGSPAAPAVYSRSIKATYSFDDKVNPFYGVFIIPAPGVFLSFAGTGAFGPYYTLYGGIDNTLNLSQNNVLTVVSGGATTTYGYTYNTANLPTSRTTTAATGVTEILWYEYESY